MASRLQPPEQVKVYWPAPVGAEPLRAWSRGRRRVAAGRRVNVHVETRGISAHGTNLDRGVRQRVATAVGPRGEAGRRAKTTGNGDAAAVRRLAQVAHGGERGEPRRRCQAVGRRTSAVAVRRVGVVRASRQPGQIFAGRARRHRTLTGRVRRCRRLVVPRICVVGDGQRGRRLGDVGGGEGRVRRGAHPEFAGIGPVRPGAANELLQRVGNGPAEVGRVGLGGGDRRVPYVLGAGRRRQHQEVGRVGRQAASPRTGIGDVPACFRIAVDEAEGVCV